MMPQAVRVTGIIETTLGAGNFAQICFGLGPN
jgi:hypothetical protein